MQVVPPFVAERLATLQKRAQVAREQVRSTARRVEDAKANAARAQMHGLVTVAEASAREVMNLETTLRGDRRAADEAAFLHRQASDWLYDLPEGARLTPSTGSGTDPASLLGCAIARAA